MPSAPRPWTNFENGLIPRGAIGLWAFGDRLRLDATHGANERKAISALADIQIGQQHIKRVPVDIGQRFGNGGRYRYFEALLLQNERQGHSNSRFIIGEKNLSLAFFHIGSRCAVRDQVLVSSRSLGRQNLCAAAQTGRVSPPCF